MFSSWFLRTHRHRNKMVPTPWSIGNPLIQTTIPNLTPASALVRILPRRSGLNCCRCSYEQAATQKPQISTFKVEAGKAMKTVSTEILDVMVDLIFQFVDQPMVPSQKNFVPVEEIGGLVKVDNCQGNIPEDFPEGIYIRNGSNPLFGGLKFSVSVFGKTDSVWVEGEGMLHALHFKKDEEGKWSFYYKNRHVETDTYKMESKRKKPVFLPVAEGDTLATLVASFFNMLRFGQASKIISNTNVFEHGGKHYSITENYIPQEIDPISLETYGNWNPGETWSRPFASHPKVAYIVFKRLNFAIEKKLAVQLVARLSFLLL